jgi:predicted house-cleaning NTP pyrophosphatase (Maf/HAM1 superfamily)
VNAALLQLLCLAHEMPASVNATIHLRCIAGTTYEDVDINTVHFNAIPEASIEALIAEGSVFHCAGGMSSAL